MEEKEDKQLRAFSKGEYIFAETEDDNQFYFYRQDDQELGEVGSIPMNMYQDYICMKMIEENSTEMVFNNIKFDTSVDGKCIRLTTFAFGEKDPFEVEHQPKGLKKLVKSLFGKSKR